MVWCGILWCIVPARLCRLQCPSTKLSACKQHQHLKHCVAACLRLPLLNLFSKRCSEHQCYCCYRSSPSLTFPLTCSIMQGYLPVHQAGDTFNKFLEFNHMSQCLLFEVIVWIQVHVSSTWVVWRSGCQFGTRVQSGEPRLALSFTYIRVCAYFLHDCWFILLLGSR